MIEDRVAPPTPDTKTRILDAAERVFAKDGFDGASLRAITAEAGVNLAAVNYHFQSKETLFSAVLQRRIEPINQRRLEMLAALGENKTVRVILDAFLRPPMELADGLRAASIRPLIGRMHSQPGEVVARIVRQQFAVVIEQFTGALQEALPLRSRADIEARLFFLIGSMAHTLAWGSLFAQFTEGRCDANDTEWMIAQLVDFGAGGLSTTAARPVADRS